MSRANALYHASIFGLEPKFTKRPWFPTIERYGSQITLILKKIYYGNANIACFFIIRNIFNYFFKKLIQFQNQLTCKCSAIGEHIQYPYLQRYNNGHYRYE